jgi:hypothetical protein
VNCFVGVSDPSLTPTRHDATTPLDPEDHP